MNKTLEGIMAKKVYLKIKDVFIFTNGNTMVCDEDGQQISELQGFILDIAQKLTEVCDKDTNFECVHFGDGSHLPLDLSWWFEKYREVEMSLDFYLGYEIDDNEIRVFDANITHNLTEMANEAGIYKALWRPEEIDATIASDIVDILTKGLEDLKKRPDYFVQFNPDNGWGSYESFVPFVKECLEACRKYPNAKIHVSR